MSANICRDTATSAIWNVALPLAIGRALARNHVEHNPLRRSPLVHLGDRLAAKIGRFPGRLRRLASTRPNWLAEAADLVIAPSPTTQRIAGSRRSLSASFTSS